MDQAYAAVYRDLYKRHWWWRAREKFLLAKLDEEASPGSRLEILDVGCGDGLFFGELSRYGSVRGIEPDAQLISDGPWRSRIHVGYLDESFEPGTDFDWILALDVLEHIPNALAFLRTARSLLSERGKLYLTVPAHRCLWTHHDVINHHVKRYTRTTLKTILAESGLASIEMRYFFHWLVPLKLGVRLKEAVWNRPSGIEAIPAEPINRLAYQVSLLEQRLTTRLNIPFGTSLYAACRRI